MVVMRALAKNPDERYQSADEMEGDLERVARGASGLGDHGGHGDAGAPPPGGCSGGRVGDGRDDDRAASRSGRPAPAVVAEEEEYQEGGDRPLWPWLVAIGFIIAALVAGFFVWQELSGKAQVPVNNYVNEPLATAQQQIHAAGLGPPAVNHAPNDRFKKGIVFKQDPSAGHKVDKGGTVTLWVSTGPPKVPVPAVKGQQWTAAQQTLVNAGLQPVEHIVPGNTKGQVTATDPPAGQKVPKGSKVRVNVMSGPVTAAVPNVVGIRHRRGPTALHNAGFNGNPTYVDNSAPAGPGHQPESRAGHAEPQGTTINLTSRTARRR